MALSRVGVRERIASLTEETEEARICNLHYDLALTSALALHPWPFASKRKALTLIEEKPSIEWAFRYALPIDCIEPLYIEGAARNLPIESRPRWELEADSSADRTTLLADVPNAVLKYTSRSVSEASFPPYFVPVMSWMLADFIAIPLTVKAEVSTAVATQLARALSTAKAHASNQGQADEALDSEFIRART